jgi:predicted secreted protein
MKKTRFLAVFAGIFLAAASVFGQYQTVSASRGGPQIFPVADLKEGMRGTARSVFRGTKSEEFSVEILGVIPNWIGPKQDLIVGKLSGANAERTFVFAGMSGSPVYIDGKLVGAISYSFPFAKEPICGITPFEQMISLVEQAPQPRLASREPKTFSYAEFLSEAWRPSMGETFASRPLASGFAADSRLMAVAGQTFVPIATPVTFSGISQNVIDMLAPDFQRAGLMPVAATGGNTGITPLKPANENTLLGGDSVVVHLARGDIQIAAAGTVTLRDGNKIYAFGHPFFGLGGTSLPMSESHVVTVVPNANNSFKLTVPDAMVGTMTQDRSTGIYGKLGESPRMLPVKIWLTTSRGRSEEINFESAFDELLTPLIINAGVGGALQANERGLGDSTIVLTGEIRIKGEEPIKLNRRVAGTSATAFAANAAAAPVGALLRADFDGLEITGITMNMTSVDGGRTGVVDRIAADKAQVRAGETVEITAFSRTESGTMLMQKVPVTIPADTTPGQISIIVGDGNAVQQNTAVTQFTPRSAAELIATLNRMKRPDRLYAVLTRTSTGAVVGTSEMPNLPPSVLATLNNDRTAGGSKPSVRTVIAERELPLLDHIISGSQTLTIEVVR